jgi:hypothetical protein
MRDMAKSGPAPQVTDDELIEAIESRDKPYATAKYVAGQVGLSENRTRERLQRLAEDKEIHQGSVGSRYTIYWSEGSFLDGDS